MFKNRLFRISLIIIMLMALSGVAIVVVYNTAFSQVSYDKSIDVDQLSASEIERLSVDTESITTNLYSEDYVVTQFSILLDSRHTKREFEMREAEVKSIIISVLNSQSPDDLRGEEGITQLNHLLQDRFNEILQEGHVLRVLTIDLRIQ